MDLDVGVYGRVTSPRNGSMASVQVGKAVFVKESYTTLGNKLTHSDLFYHFIMGKIGPKFSHLPDRKNTLF